MRASFDRQLDSLLGQLVVMAASATSTIRWASESLFTADLAVAARVLDAAGDLGESRRTVESRTLTLLATQQPVATDLRLAWASVQVANELERMGLLAAHISKIMIRRHPGPVVYGPLIDVVRAMAETAERLAWNLTRVLEVRDPRLCAEIVRGDDEMDALQRRLFAIVLSDWTYGIAAAVDAVQLGRFYERHADHTVGAAQQVDFLMTGRVA